MVWVLVLSLGCLVERHSFEEQRDLIRDADGDGFNILDGDCDDANEAVSPMALEVCDSVDNDCDGLVDDADDSLSPLYVDSDGDGYGDDDQPVFSCDNDAGYTDVAGDCDDTNDLVNPSMTEVCGNLLDDDCADSSAECELVGQYSVLDTQQWFLPIEDGQANSPFISAGVDIDGDNTIEGLFEIILPDNTRYIAGYSFDEDASGVINEGPAFIIGEDGPEINSTSFVSVFQDVNISGDYAVSAMTDDELHLFIPPLSGSYRVDEADLSISMGVENLIQRATSAGDTNYDGTGDVALVTSPQYSDYAGAEIWLLSADAEPGGSLKDRTTAVLFSDRASEYGTVGLLLGPGDLTGDGVDDVVVARPGLDSAGTAAGGVSIVVGPIDSDVDLDDADFTMTGDQPGDLAGSLVACLGDTDGDGYSQIAISSPFADVGSTSASGTVYVFDADEFQNGALSDTSAQVVGSSYQGFSGFMSPQGCGGDVNQDGLNDLVIGSAKSERFPDGEGTTNLFYGPVSGTISVDMADAIFVGDEAQPAVGIGIMGDINRDGYDDILSFGFEGDFEINGFSMIPGTGQ